MNEPGEENMTIEKRGEPGGGMPIHFRDPRTISLEMYCRTGTFHVFYTDDVAEVNCEACLQDMIETGYHNRIPEKEK